MALRKTVLAGGLGLLAASAIAASQAKPLEAPVPEHGVPAAEHVENVLRATYVLPAGRGEAFANFLQQNAASGIDVRFGNDQLTVVAPADAQKALGGFIEKCLSKEPLPNGEIPNYIDPNEDFFGSPTLAPPATRVPSRTKLRSDSGMKRPPGGPAYDDSSDAGFGPVTPSQQRTPAVPGDGFNAN
jgi:hypothetical protein